MKHIKALLIKFVIISIVLFSILPTFSTANLTEIFITSLLVTGAAYLIGDLFILPKLGNLIASISDFALATASIWLLSMLFIGTGYRILIASIFAATFISLSEALFHVYMKEKVLNNEGTKEATFVSTNNLQTEFAEEEDIHHLKNNNKN